MKVFWIFCLAFCLGWPSVSLASRSSRPGGTQTGRTQKNTVDKKAKSLEKALADSGLLIYGSYASSGLSFVPYLRKELSRYCPNQINALSRNIEILSGENLPEGLADDIERGFKSCVGKIVERYDKLRESFVKPVNSAYFSGGSVALLSIHPSVKSDFDAGRGVKNSSKIKELGDKLDHYTEYQKSCGSKIANIKACFGSRGSEFSSGYDDFDSYNCNIKYRTLKSYLEATVQGKSCGEMMTEFSDYARTENFRRFVNLPRVCSAGGDAGLTKIRGFLLGNPALPEGSNIFSKCEKIITESKKCACDNQGICWPGENACENRKHYPEFEQQCQREIQNCQNNCLAEIDKFKTAYLEYFYLGRFDSFGVHSQASACKNPINELSGLFQQSIGAYDQDLRNNNFNNLNGLGIRGQLENAIVAKCENIVTELQKKKESVEENCAKEKEEEDKEDEKKDGEKSSEETKNEENTQQQNQNQNPAQTYNPANTGFGNNSYSSDTNKKRTTNDDRIAQMDPNRIYWIEKRTGKNINELQNIGIGDPKGRLYERHGSLIEGTYPLPFDLTQEENDLLYEASKQEWKERDEAFRQRLAEVGARPGEGYFDANGKFRRYPDPQEAEMIEIAFGKAEEPEPTLKEKIHNDLDPKIRDFLRTEETAYRDMEDDEQARHNAGLRGKLRGLRRFAKRRALATYNAFVPESRESFRRRMRMFPEDVDSREVHKLILIVTCYQQRPSCGIIITHEEYEKSLKRLEELAQMSLTIPDFSDPEEKPKTE